MSLSLLFLLFLLMYQEFFVWLFCLVLVLGNMKIVNKNLWKIRAIWELVVLSVSLFLSLSLSFSLFCLFYWCIRNFVCDFSAYLISATIEVNGTWGLLSRFYGTLGISSFSDNLYENCETRWLHFQCIVLTLYSVHCIVFISCEKNYY